MPRSQAGSEDRVIPLSVVFITIGMIILITVCVVWAVVPTTMPPMLYDIVMESAPDSIAQIVPTRTEAAALPAAEILLPDNLVPITTTVPVTTAVSPSAPTQLIIPAIELDAPIVPISTTAVVYNDKTYQQWNVPAGYVAGWHQDSAAVGANGNLVLNGHHNISGEVFRHLIDLKIGNEITLTSESGQHIYTITDKNVLAERGQPISVRIKNAEWIAPTEDERVTLITCWPYNDNSHRLVIVAKPKVIMNNE